MSIRGLNEKGGPELSGNPEDKIPWIKFASPPRSPRDQAVMVGSAKVSVEGVLGHDDLPELESFDVILFHELMHAHLFQRRVTTRLRELGLPKKPPALGALVGIKKPPTAELEDAVEEALVVGLLGGKGVACRRTPTGVSASTGCDRATRRSASTRPQRSSAATAGGRLTTAPKAIYDALVAIGLTPAQARFVADGTLPG